MEMVRNALKHQKYNKKKKCKFLQFRIVKHPGVVVVYINTIKTTFDLNFDFYQAFNQMDTHKHREKSRCQWTAFLMLLVDFLFEKSLL